VSTTQVKTKHILAVLSGLIVILGVIWAAAPGYIYSRAKAMEAEGNHKAAGAYYETLYTFFPRAEETGRAIYFAAQQELHYYSPGQKPGYIYIFPTARVMSGDPERKLDVEGAIEKLETLRDRFPASPFALHALRELGKAYYILHDYENAVHYLNKSIIESNFQAAESTLLLAQIYFERREYQKSLDLLNRSLQKEPGMDPLKMMELKGIALAALGRCQAAEDVFKMLPVKAAEIFNKHTFDMDAKNIRMNVEHWEKVSQTHLRRVQAMQLPQREKSGIAGRVLLKDKGLSGVEVYLIDKAVEEGHYTGSMDHLPRAITGSNGGFSFPDLLPGDYALAVGVPVQRVKGHVMQQPNQDIQLKPGQTIQRDLKFVPKIKLGESFF